MHQKEEIHKKVMPFGEHLEELRRRLLFAIIPIFPLIIGAWLVRKTTIPILMAPMEAAFRRAQTPVRLLATGPLENFMAYLKISMILALLIAAPWGLYQLWLFVAPGLYNRERRFIYLLAPLSVTLTFLGVAFMYFVMLPLVLVFCLSFAGDVPAPSAAVAPLPKGVVLASIPVLEADPEEPALGDTWINSVDMVQRTCIGTTKSGTPQLAESLLSLGGLVRQEYRVSEYLGLLITMSLAFTVSFQLPVVVLLLGWAGIITPALLAKYRKHAIFASILLGAVVSPTGEPVASTAMAVPLYLLYELGLLLLRALPASRVAGMVRRSADATAGDE